MWRVWQDEGGVIGGLVVKRIGIVLLSALIGWSIWITPARAADGITVFENHCAGCHVNGGNIVRRGKTLKLKALEQNGYSTEAAIAQIVTNGKGNMSAYRDRLTSEEIQAVSAYVLDQARQNWKK